MKIPSILTENRPFDGGILDMIWGAVGKNMPTEIVVPESLRGFAKEIAHKATLLKRVEGEFHISCLKFDGEKFTWKLCAFWSRRFQVRSIVENRIVAVA